MKRPPFRDIFWLFLSSRLLLVLVTYFGFVLLTAPKYSSAPVDLTALFSTWNHWDAANFTRIAQYGYQNIYDVAFFPLFPLLISIFAYPFGSWGYIAVGMIISNLALLGAMFVIYQLTIEYGGEKVAFRSILYLCIFPTAFYFFSAYNESLFLFLSSATLLSLRKQRWWIAGALGLLASLTRSAGLCLVVPFLYELWQARDSFFAQRPLKALFNLLPIALIPLGTGLFALYCWRITGNPLAFANVQSHWGRFFTWPWTGLWQAINELLMIQPFGSFNQAHILLDMGATLAAITLTIISWFKLRPSYALWNLMLVLFILLSPSTGEHDPLISNQRFIIEQFPVFMTLGVLGTKHPRLHQIIRMLFPALLAVLGILFVMNRWMV